MADRVWTAWNIMKFFLDTALLWLGLAVVLLVLGALAARFHLFHPRSAKRYSVLLATLLAAVELMLTQRGGYTQGQEFLDYSAWFGVLWFHSFFMLWGGVSWGLRHVHGADFGESSMLSMQYLDSHEDVDASQAGWAQTQQWPAHVGLVPGESATTVAQDGTRIPVVRH